MVECTTCKQEKPETEFYKDRKKASGRFAECKKCNRERNRGWWSENYHHVKRKYHKNCKRYRGKDKRAQLVRQAKWRAAQRGLEFSITKEDVVWNEVCPVFGLALNYDGQGRKTPSPNAASLDRIDNSKGYVPGNVIVISHRANAIKRDATLEELKAITDWLNGVLNNA